jgi:site-specific DNA recombinase
MTSSFRLWSKVFFDAKGPGKSIRMKKRRNMETITMRCAIYARYSSDLQRESSIEDQIRQCREFARRQSWVVVERYVRFDRAIPGATIAGRQALDDLVRAAKQEPQSFDKVLIDDTSRLARDLPDLLRITRTLAYYGVSVYSVTQGIDSRQKGSEQAWIFNGMMDEQYIVGLRDKVHRGQEGRALKGLQPGGKCYGYANVPIEDPTRPGKYGRPAVSGVELHVIEQQAAVVRRIFKMYEAGMGLALIAKTLNAEGVEAPQPPRTRTLRAWCPSSIREMLRNERYRGVNVWNRTEKRRNPETGRKTSRPRPQSDWRRIEVPKCRIVPEELWNAVQERMILVRQQFGNCQSGGMNRTVESRRYLFSGILICGTCSSRMVIGSGRGTRGYVRYACPSHRYRGVCANKLTIRQDRLEEQLLAALEDQLLKPEIIAHTIQRVYVELRQRIAEISKHPSNIVGLQNERVKLLQAKADRLGAAIADAGHSPTLLSSLAAVESQLDLLDQQIKAHRPVVLEFTLAEVEEFVSKNLLQLRSLLASDPTAAKTALGQHIKTLVLTPRQMATGPVFEVSSAFDLLPNGSSSTAGSDVMLVVARDGIEPPTPAFSGLRSTD